MALKLNLGCGEDVRLGWWNGDKDPVAVSFYIDGQFVLVHRFVLGTYPWPWETNEVDEILMSHVLEHVESSDDLVHSIREAYRVLKPGGVLDLRVPFYRGFDAVADPTHLRFFELGSFDHIGRYAPFDWSLQIRVLPGLRILKKQFWLTEGAYAIACAAAEKMSRFFTWLIVRMGVRAAQTMIPPWAVVEWRMLLKKSA